MKKFAIALAVAALTIGLGGCPRGVTINPRVDAPRLPEVPARLKTCFTAVTKIPVRDMSSEELVQLLAKVRVNEVRKTRCGRDIVTWYEGVRRSYGPK